MITIKQIEAFYWASVLGSFEAAAGKLNTAQSTISKRVQELEYQSKVILFDRSKRSCRLTMKGQELLRHAEDLLQSSNQIVRALGTDEAYTGRFCFGVTELIALTWLPELILGVRAKYPNLVLEFEIDLTGKLFERLESCQIDLVIAPSTKANPALTQVPLTELELVWMCRPDLEVPSQASLHDLVRYPILTQSGGSAMQAMVGDQLTSNNVKVPQIISCNSMMALAELAAAGFGLTCLPKRYFADEVEQGVLRVIDINPEIPPLPYSVFYRGEDLDICGEIAGMASEVCDFRRLRR